MQRFVQLTSLYVRIALLRSSPQDVPATAGVFWASIIAAVATYVFAISSEHGVGDALGMVAVDMVILSAILHGGLLCTGHGERFAQGFTAFCGTAALINIVFWPVFLGIADTTTPDLLNTLALVVLLLLIVWNLIVAAHIFRHCFGVGPVLGAITSVAYLIVVIKVTRYLFPEMT